MTNSLLRLILIDFAYKRICMALLRRKILNLMLAVNKCLLWHICCYGSEVICKGNTCLSYAFLGIIKICNFINEEIDYYFIIHYILRIQYGVHIEIYCWGRDRYNLFILINVYITVYSVCIYSLCIANVYVQ